jgi:hypothetical protein
MFEVMITTTLRKSTVRPWPSVRRQSILSEQHVEHVGVRLLDLVEQHHRVRAAAHRLRELTFIVADVAGRSADEPADRVLLHVLGHVDADHRPLVVEHELGQRAGQLGLAHAGRAQEQERADRPVGIAEPGPPAPHGVGHRVDGVVLTHHALREPLFHLHELLDLALEQAGDRDAGPLRDGGRDVLLVDLLAQHPAALTLVSEPPVELGQLPLEAGDDAEAQLGRTVEITLALRLRHRLARGVDVLLDLADLGDAALLGLPLGLEAASLLLQLGQLGVDLAEPLARARAVVVTGHRHALALKLPHAPLDLASIGCGIESISMRMRAAASSMRSMALSGRKRSPM